MFKVPQVGHNTDVEIRGLHSACWIPPWALGMQFDSDLAALSDCTAIAQSALFHKALRVLNMQHKAKFMPE